MLETNKHRVVEHAEKLLSFTLPMRNRLQNYTKKLSCTSNIEKKYTIYEKKDAYSKKN